MMEAFLVLIGLVIGSFLNVCIFRIPKGESIVSPGSHCQSCQHAIAWHDNIPVVSYLSLGGRCRHCRAVISPQYAIVEAATAALFLLFYRVFGFSWEFGVYLLFSLALLVETAIDFRHQIIPDVITLPGIAAGLILSFFIPALQHETVSWKGAAFSAVGILTGGGFLYVTALVAERIFKQEAMGGGDVKLMAMVGAFLGWRGVLWTVFFSSLFGSVVGIYLKLTRGAKVIPYGPYIALAAFLYIFYGWKWTENYFRFLST